MRIQRLELKGLKGLDETEISFGGGMTLLYEDLWGRRILDAVQVAAGTFLRQMPNCSGCTFRSSDGAGAGLTAVFADPMEDTPLEIRRNAFIAENGRLLTTTRDALPLKELAGKWRRREYDASAVLPLFAFNGAGRKWDWHTSRGNTNWMRMTRLAVYSDACRPDATVGMFAGWFADMWYSIRDQRIKKMAGSVLYDSSRLDCFSSLLNAVKNAVDECLRPAGLGGLDFDIETRRLYVHINGRRTEAGNAAGDCGAVLGAVADLACRCCLLNGGQKGMALAATPGMVLLDWTKLRAGWIQGTLAAMRRTFPSLQFIVALPHGMAGTPDDVEDAVPSMGTGSGFLGE